MGRGASAVKFKYTLKIWLAPSPDGEAWSNLDYEFPGRKLRGGGDSLATSDNAAIRAASGSWAYLQYPASSSKITAQEYGLNEQLEELAAEMSEIVCCAELWRHKKLNLGMPPKKIRGFVSFSDQTRGGKWAELDATTMLKAIA